MTYPRKYTQVSSTTQHRSVRPDIIFCTPTCNPGPNLELRNPFFHPYHSISTPLLLEPPLPPRNQEANMSNLTKHHTIRRKSNNQRNRSRWDETYFIPSCSQYFRRWFVTNETGFTRDLGDSAQRIFVWERWVRHV